MMLLFVLVLLWFAAELEAVGIRVSTWKWKADWSDFNQSMSWRGGRLQDWILYLILECVCCHVTCRLVKMFVCSCSYILC